MRQVRLALLISDKITCTGILGFLQSDANVSYETLVFTDFGLFSEHKAEVDILLVDVNGLRISEVEDYLQQWLRAHGHLKIIVISNRLTVIYVHRILQAGAKGFIYRDDLAEALLNSLDLVRRDVITLSPQVSQVFTSGKYLYMLNDIKPLDMQVLRLTARGMTVKAIATELGISTRSIYRCRDKLREILNVPTIETLIQAAQEQGLLDLEDD